MMVSLYCFSPFGAWATVVAVQQKLHSLGLNKKKKTLHTSHHRDHLPALN